MTDIFQEIAALPPQDAGTFQQYLHHFAHQRDEELRRQGQRRYDSYDFSGMARSDAVPRRAMADIFAMVDVLIATALPRHVATEAQKRLEDFFAELVGLPGWGEEAAAELSRLAFEAWQSGRSQKP